MKKGQAQSVGEKGHTRPARLQDAMQIAPRRRHIRQVLEHHARHCEIIGLVQVLARRDIAAEIKFRRWRAGREMRKLGRIVIIDRYGEPRRLPALKKSGIASAAKFQQAFMAEGFRQMQRRRLAIRPGPI